MTAEYQELWKRYRKQGVRFRQLQKFLKTSTKKLMEAAASDDTMDRAPSIDKQRSGATRCHAAHTDTNIATASSMFSTKVPGVMTARRRRSEIANRGLDADVSSGKDGRDNAPLFSDDPLGTSDPFLSHDSSALDGRSPEDVTLGVLAPSTRPSLSSGASSAHRKRPSLGRVNWKSDT